MGIAVIVGIGVALLIPALPSIGLRLAGFEAIESNISQATAEPIPAIQNAQTTSNITLSAGGFGTQVLTASSAYTIQTGTDTNGEDITQIAVNESGIRTLCAQYTDVCSGSASTFRNVTVDLGIGRATITGEAYIRNLNTWQPVSAIVSLTPDNRVQVSAVNINGTLFAVPDNDIGQTIRDIQSTANQALGQLSLQSGGNLFRLSDIVFTETQLVATFR